MLGLGCFVVRLCLFSIAWIGEGTWGIGMAVLPEVLEILACPVPECRSRLEPKGDELVCAGCSRGYRIEGNWPVLIPEEAAPPRLGPEQTP